ncbi:glutamine--tRNA ligase, cytoplasmic [Histomonas meleagridis]|nr:glutamine--tRNA ligase, cytoplasmic [Histomonas meleagridis]KAH0806305.1 glutamine--tRNA ligase, cytoplasmic [Histomonas meleagridis]
MSEETKKVFLSIGISETEANKLLKNQKSTSRLLLAIQEAKIPSSGCPQAKGVLLQKLSQKVLPNAAFSKIALYIGEDKIKTQEQLASIMDFVSKNNTYTDEQFDAESGIGIEVTNEQIVSNVNKAFGEDSIKSIIEQKGKKAAVGSILQKVKSYENMKFANSGMIMSEINKVLSTIPDKAPVKQAPKKEAPKKEEPKKEVEKAESAEDEDNEIDFAGIVAKFPTPADNAMKNPDDVQKQHMEITNGSYMTRFPPEPNGWIHIGHAKAMYLDFGLAELKGGKCYMRLDDTNPAKEKDEFIEGIKSDVQWMGFHWWKITHTSDYFHQLYEFAIQLIKAGLAYVCHQTKAEIKHYRQNKLPSPWRDRPVEESLREFELMRIGYYTPSEATLRLKMDYQSLNPNMRDQVAYRIIYSPHPRTKDEWCIYPTYDYSHCVIDSIEHVTHSLCTLEFESRRDSYYWVLDALRIYKPFVWEFSRLNITYTVMSKRRLQALVQQHLVNGWDDPRMPTVAGLRRRGFTASAIRTFVKGVGYTRNVKSSIDYEKLEYVQSQELDETAPRMFCVLDPLKVTIKNMNETIELSPPQFPKYPNKGVRPMKISSVVYIDRSDFQEIGEKGFKRLTKENPVGLKYANFLIKVVDLVKENDQVVEIIAEKFEGKAKAYIQWVSDGAIKAQVRLYDKLFMSKDPMAVEGDWTKDLNKDSIVIKENAMVEPMLKDAKEYDRFQFERLGYFVVDRDSTDEKKVFNRTMSLKSGKF